jgi:hypothetical protein
MEKMSEFTKLRLEGAVNAARQSGAVTEAEKAQVEGMRQAALRQAEYVYIYRGWVYTPASPEPDVNVMRVRTMKLVGFVAPQLASLDGVAPAQPLAQKPADSGTDVTRKDIKQMSKDATAIQGLANSLPR